MLDQVFFGQNTVLCSHEMLAQNARSKCSLKMSRHYDTQIAYARKSIFGIILENLELEILVLYPTLLV